MTAFEVRPFNRGDREQLTALVNAHAEVVVPGLAVSVNGVLSQLEREPGEFVVDPWVTGRTTLVAEQRGRVAAAAHLLRYGAGAEVGESYRDAGEIRWLLCWPAAPFWPDSLEAGHAVAAAAVDFLSRSGATRLYADGALPAPGVYGIPEQWPHVRDLLERAGFSQGERTEIVFLAEVAELPRPVAPIPGLAVTRTLGVNGSRFSALLAGDVIGYVEVAPCTGHGARFVRHEGWADVGNLHVAEQHRRRGLAGWLLGQAAEWLRLGHVDRLLDYATPQEEGYIAFLEHAGFSELTRTTRGWERPPASGHPAAKGLRQARHAGA
jgi:GNAT superfamily N-acetyltransferase